MKQRNKWFWVFFVIFVICGLELEQDIISGKKTVNRFMKTWLKKIKNRRKKRKQEEQTTDEPAEEEKTVEITNRFFFFKREKIQRFMHGFGYRIHRWIIRFYKEHRMTYIIWIIPLMGQRDFRVLSTPRV